jgi:hypothetical protein
MASLYKPSIVEYRLPDGSYRDPDGKRGPLHRHGVRRALQHHGRAGPRQATANEMSERVSPSHF